MGSLVGFFLWVRHTVFMLNPGFSRKQKGGLISPKGWLISQVTKPSNLTDFVNFKQTKCIVNC